MRVLITGVNGFIGSAIARRLQEEGVLVRGVGRHGETEVVADYYSLDLCVANNWQVVLADVDVIVHCAAIADENASADSSLVKRTNVDATLNLAKNAEIMGVRRFIFLSSVKAVGEQTVHGRPFTETDVESPASLYGKTKLEAERKLRGLLSSTRMDLVILRLPMVYGAPAKGNFRKLFSIARSGIPLPLAGITNLRSFLSIDNCADVIMLSLASVSAAGNTFFVSDGYDISTREMILLIRRNLSMGPRLFFVPIFLVNLFGRLTGRVDVINKLFGCLQVDITKAREVLGWSPPNSVELELKKAVSLLVKE